MKSIVFHAFTLARREGDENGVKSSVSHCDIEGDASIRMKSHF
jgi:hypothetical protein